MTFAKVCAYNAIAVIKEKVLIFTELCHGCGGCSLLCPEDAIEEANRPIGALQRGKAGSIPFIDGKLNLGEALTVPLVRAVKRASLEINPTQNRGIFICVHIILGLLGETKKDVPENF